LDRRTFIASSGLAAVAAAFPAPVLAQGRSGSGDAALNALFERIFQQMVQRSPELATSLGLDKGDNAGLKGRLTPRTLAERARQQAQIRAALAELEAVDRSALSPAAKLNLEVVAYSLNTQTVAAQRFGLDSAIRPYRIFQQGGAYFSVPDFLNTAHTINARDDAEAYLSRLEAFAVALDQDSAMQRIEASRGYVAPAWSLDLTLGQMAKLREQKPDESSIVQSLVKRAKARDIDGRWEKRASAIVEERVYPALDRQMALVRELRGASQAGDGVWRVPHGEEIYAVALEQATTTRFSADEVHRMGLQQVAQISAQLDRILKGQGFTRGSVGERLAALNVTPSQLYPNDDAGRTALIASLNEGVQGMSSRLPRAFATLPKAPLEIRRVPVEIQDGASNGYYNRASLDGSRPAIYFINLKDTGDWPRYSLPALTYHEGTPGHHLQIGLAQESEDIPTLRKVGGFSAYSEGWALYAEQLADELGAYATPLERAGYLQSFLFRAARLVVDTGLHARKWSREKATDYLVATTGFARPRSQREVERYCTQAGQACSYKVGHMAWTRARAEAEKSLGRRFDLKQFHEILKDGAMPLTILERRIRERTAAAKRSDRHPSEGWDPSG
jgi:uncharacterized protein (DUF885 family)